MSFYSYICVFFMFTRDKYLFLQKKKSFFYVLTTNICPKLFL